MGSKNEKVLGLFLGIALTLASGCSSNTGHTHVDKDKDGYCDIDGQPMPTSSNSSTSHYNSFRGGSTSSGSTSSNSTSDNISSGSAPKGGIGSHSSGGGG